MEAPYERCFNSNNNHGCSKMGGATAAPFVLKTYKMVDDPATDSMIGWGRCNNSFVVVDPFGFSMHLLPSHFKHRNFSSFVRQLNTYGFRKVDPDRWEFAHESFLRGQTHLLHFIVRRNSTATGSSSNRGVHEGKVLLKEEDLEAELESQERMAAEVEMLKQEQRATREEMRRMWARLQETERKPKQLLAFLLKVVQNPQLLLRLSRPSLDVKGEEVDDHHRLMGGGCDHYDYLDRKRKRPLMMISSSEEPPPLVLPRSPPSSPGASGTDHLLDVPMESVMTPEFDDHCSIGTDAGLRAFAHYGSLSDVGDEAQGQPYFATDGIVPSISAGKHVADGRFEGQCVLMPELGGGDVEIESGAFPCALSFSAGAGF